MVQQLLPTRFEKLNHVLNKKMSRPPISRAVKSFLKLISRNNEKTKLKGKNPYKVSIRKIKKWWWWYYSKADNQKVRVNACLTPYPDQ